MNAGARCGIDRPAVLDEIVREQQCIAGDPEAVVLCPRCSEEMEMGMTRESIDYPGILICRNCAENEEACGKLFPVPLEKWGFVEILREGVGKTDSQKRPVPTDQVREICLTSAEKTTLVLYGKHRERTS